MCRRTARTVSRRGRRTGAFGGRGVNGAVVTARPSVIFITVENAEVWNQSMCLLTSVHIGTIVDEPRGGVGHSLCSDRKQANVSSQPFQSKINTGSFSMASRPVALALVDHSPSQRDWLPPRVGIRLGCDGAAEG